MEWWRGFSDPQLAKTVEAALAANADIALATTRVSEARAQYNFARAQLFPSLAFAGGGGRQRDLSPFGTGLTQYAGRGEFSISYDTDLFGRLSFTRSAARAELLSSEASQESVRLAIASAAARGYIDLCALDMRLIVLRQTLDARAASLKVEERRTHAGYSSQLELAQAQAEYESTAQQIPSIELAISREEDGLRVLLGQAPGPIARSSNLDNIVEPVVPAAVPSALLRQRPDIVAAEAEVVAGERSLDASRAAFMPQIQLTAAGGYVGGEALPHNPVSVFSAGASILAPVLEFGRLRAQEDVAVARRDRAAFAYQKAALGAFSEVEDSLAAVNRLREQEEALKRQRASIAHALSLATNRYRAGYSPYLEQLDAQRGLLSADLALVGIRAERLNAAVTLYQALGGGWQAPTIK